VNWTSEQRAILDSQAAHQVVIAGAGTGKTAVLTERLARWVESGTIDPATTAVITFTRRAGEELRRRLSARGLADLPWRYIGTSYGLAVLHLWHCGRTMLPATGHDIEMIARMEADRIGIDRSLAPRIARRICEDRGCRAQKGQEVFLLLATRQYMQQHQIVPVAEAITQCLRMCESQSPRDALRGGIRTLVWDEYQDTGDDEAALHALIAPNRSFVVGDPRQAIYGFRGGSVRHMHDHATVHAWMPLSECWRCDQDVVSEANRIAAQAWPHLPPLRTRSAKHGMVLPVDPSDIAAWGNDGACICRTNRQVEEVAERVPGARILSPAFDVYAKPPWSTLYDLCRRVLRPDLEWLPDVSPTWKPETPVSEVSPAASAAGLSMTVEEYAVWYQRRDLQDSLTEESGPVVMTIHAAKGLEWATVCLVGADRAEPALRYVGVTRARHGLALCTWGA